MNVKDRNYQIWEHRPLSVPLWSSHVFEQKLEYIHNSPVNEKWRLADLPENYYYYSAHFYILNEDQFGFITYYKGDGVQYCQVIAPDSAEIFEFWALQFSVIRRTSSNNIIDLISFGIQL